MVRMAYNWRSVLRALNSLSSAVKLEESSEVAEVSPPSLPSAKPVLSVPSYLLTAAQQGGLVVGEVLVHAEAGDEADGRGEIGRGHLVIDVVLCRVDGAGDVLGLHAAEVEEHDDQTAVFQLVRLCGKVVVDQVRDGLLLGGGCAGDGGGLGQRHGLVYILVVEADDALRLLVLGDGEVGLLEALDDGAGLFVAHDDVGQHGLCAFTLRVSTVVCFATAICAMAGTGSPAGETAIPATKIAAIARRIADLLKAACCYLLT